MAHTDWMKISSLRGAKETMPFYPLANLLTNSHARQLHFLRQADRSVQPSLSLRIAHCKSITRCFFSSILNLKSEVKSEMVRRRFSLMNLTILYSIQLLFLLLTMMPVARAVWVDLPSSGTKCVSEDIQRNVVVLADYFVVGDAERHSEHVPTISVRVTSPYGNNLHHQENITHGQFAFTTSEDGNYLACFWMDSNHQADKGVTIGIDWKTGIAARDWESVAKKEKIEGVELELRKLEGHVQAIRENLIYLKHKESEMREVSERTNSKVAWFSIMSIGVCIAVSFIQVFYLKHYFQKKKLI